MGDIVQSRCKCGFESSELYLGGGMMNFMEDCEIPFYCNNCQIVFTRNILSEVGFKNYNRCPRCKKKVQYYGSISEDLHENDHDDYIFNWGIGLDRRYYLKNINYHCPRCKKEEMIFYTLGKWD